MNNPLLLRYAFIIVALKTIDQELKLKYWVIILMLSISLFHSNSCIAQDKAKKPSLGHLKVGRQQLYNLMIFPGERCSLSAEYRGSYVQDGVVVERWVWQSEPGSWVTSILYLPEKRDKPIPGIVITNGHGDSKSSLYNKYTGPLFAKLGIACLLHDAIGEEERNLTGSMGSRAHDKNPVLNSRPYGGLEVFSKMVWDGLRALDFLSVHSSIDASRLAVAGSSLGGSLSLWVGALDERLKAVMVSSYAFSPDYSKTNKRCSGQPFTFLQQKYGEEALLLSILDHAELILMNGKLDNIIDKLEDGSVWRYTDSIVLKTRHHTEQQALRQKLINWYDPKGGHRPYYLFPDNLAWLVEHLGPLQYSKEQVEELPTITLEKWMEKYGMVWPEKYRELYWVDRHYKGSIYADLGVIPFPEDELKALRPDELGDEKYTLEGWVKNVLPHRNSPIIIND